MKKLLTSVLLCGALLSLSACGSDDNSSDNSKEKELQTTIDSQSKEIKDLKAKNSELEKENKKKAQIDKDNKKKDKEIEELKKVLASKKASNQQQTKVTSSAQNKQQSTQSTVQQDNTTPSFANEAEAEAYYDGFIDHESIARSISESEEEEQSRNVEEAQSMAQSAEAEGRKITSAELQSQWLKKQGIQQ